MKQKAIDAIELWFAGDLTDSELAEVLTRKQLQSLQEQVLSAIASKMLANPGKITFSEHRTLQ